MWNYFEGKMTYHGILAIGNPFLWWLATLSLVATVVLAILKRSYALLPAAAVVAVLYLPWFATSRTSFLYYMTPVAPVLAVLVAGALCLFAGGVVPRRGWIAAAGAALATAVLWDYVGRAATWIFWTLPGRAGDTLGWVGVAVGVLLARGRGRLRALAAHEAVPAVDGDGRGGDGDRHRRGVRPRPARCSASRLATSTTSCGSRPGSDRMTKGRSGGRDGLRPAPFVRTGFCDAPQPESAVRRRGRRQAMTAAMMAFCACSRFSAWSKTTELGEYSTSSVISSPQCAGRQCMTLTCGPATLSRSMLTW